MKTLPLKSSTTKGHTTEYVAFRALGFPIDDAALLAYGNLSSVMYYCYNDVANEND